jgi:hypothetical protein
MHRDPVTCRSHWNTFNPLTFAQGSMRLPCLWALHTLLLPTLHLYLHLHLHLHLHLYLHLCFRLSYVLRLLTMFTSTTGPLHILLSEYLNASDTLVLSSCIQSY